MTIDFQEHRIEFPVEKGGPRSNNYTFTFPSEIKKAISVLNGFHIAFSTSEHPLHRMEVNARVNGIDHNEVQVFVVFALRDRSGNFDDAYSGFIDVAVFVDRE
jgi:hypothetical protein